jgi:hypothetical protein
MWRFGGGFFQPNLTLELVDPTHKNHDVEDVEETFYILTYT